MIVYRLPCLLTVAAWESCLSGEDRPFGEDGVWRPAAVEQGIELDFSAVEFVHFEALTCALLLLDSAVRGGVAATVVLPTGALPVVGGGKVEEPSGDTHAMETLDRHAAWQARAREEARAFMRDVGFFDALRPGHWPAGAVRVEDSAAPEPHLSRPEGASAAAIEPLDEAKLLRRRRILPFRWVPVDEHGASAPDVLVEALGRFTDMGLSRSDARAVTQAVLRELVENVGVHSRVDPTRPTFALIAAVLVDDDLYVSRRDGLPRPANGLADALAASGTGGQVLQLVVADSGYGLLRRLRQERAEGSSPLSARELVLRAFDRHMIGADPAGSGGTLGLWRVARLVGSYRGLVLTRSTDAVIGKSYAAADQEIFEEKLPSWAPGTVIEVILPIRDYLTRALSRPWAWRSSAHADARWEVVTCQLHPADGIGDADRARLDEAALLAQDGSRTAGVVATAQVRKPGTGFTEIGVQTALSRALDVASLTPHQAALVLVFPNADPRLLDLSVAGLNADEDREGELSQRNRVRSPILVLGASGAPLWCGGSVCLRAVLDGLTAAGGALPISEVARLWTGVGREPDRLWPTLNAHPHLITVTTAEVVLRVSAGDAVRALGEYVREHLAEAIQQSGPGVVEGYFRTPTLRVANRWIDGDQLANGTVGRDLVTFLQARAVEEAALPGQDRNRPLVVARASTTAALLAAQLSECLYRDGRFYDLPGELDLDGSQVSEQVPRRANVVICTDVLSTENTTRRAAAALVGKHAVPIAVVCVVDARTHSGPIRMFNRDIAVLSLVTVDVAATPRPEAPPVDIDPIHRRPVEPGEIPSPRRTPIAEETLLGWCAENDDSLRLGHVESIPQARHFSAYPQLDRLLRDKDAGEKVRAAIRDTFGDVTRQWQSDHLRAEGLLTRYWVWHPGSPDDYAGRLAALVSEVLTEDGASVAGVESIPRAVAGSRWTFPASLPVPAALGTVVVVDWGSLSSTSIHQMIRLAAEAGASAIVALVLLDQLDGQDSDALRAVSALRARRNGRAGPAVPTEVRFLTTSSLGRLAVPDCSLCEIRDLYEEYAESAPRALRGHAERLKQRTRLRTRAELFGEVPVDVFKVPIRGEEMADYLRWRGLLLRALGETSARQEVLDRITRLDDGDPADDSPGKWTRDGLLRLTAAEQTWLKLPPLRFAAARERLAAICETALRSSQIGNPWFRTQAVMVMAAAEAQTFVALLPKLMARAVAVDEREFSDQLLLECHRLLRRPLEDMPIDHAALRSALTRCRDRLESMLGHDETRVVRRSVGIVKELLGVVEIKTMPRPRNPQHGWWLLREKLSRHVRAHRMEATLLRVRDFVEDLVFARPPSTRIREALSDWEQCSTQLCERALVNMTVLNDILTGDYVSDRFGQRDQRLLLAAISDPDFVELRLVQEGLEDLIERSWTPEDPEWRRQHAELLSRLRWWHRMFTTTHVGPGRTALFVELVDSAPVVPAPRVDRLLQSSGMAFACTGREIGEVTEAFCPGPLFDEAVAHVVANIGQHAISGATPVVRVEYSLVERRRIRLIIRNTGTRATDRLGHGLRSLNDKLRPFGGSIAGVRLDGEWAFATEISLSVWQGV
ncbi:hypothetical protein GCM10027598_80550 [Amycolatopsis oliviviridis]|uniref:ATP-binding protein n=1 Tax=Amycolatopsis oliviviridis TaxID=1471590 RepID=A0ABQ3L846_9PSEU|nr:hypothetical protein [Amycolatopsis oliviviridis]GHH05884.1 hypothetical protein GCM10017790_10460 [Amycolatopsis oliviviridis]